MKNIIKNKAHLIFWCYAPVYLLYGLWEEDQVVELNAHDSYLILRNFHIALASCLFFMGIGLAYWGLIKGKFRLMYGFSVIHLFVSVLGSLSVFISSYLYMGISYQEKRLALVDYNELIS